MGRLIDDKQVIAGLRVLAEMGFPKRCNGCGREYATVAEFAAATHALHAHCSGLEPGHDEDDNPIIALFRKCPCGSTLRASFLDRYDTSSAGALRRQRFSEIFHRLVAMGIPSEMAHDELLKFVRCQPNDLLRLRSARILVVDDSDLMCSMLCGILRRHHYEVVGEAHNGLIAIEMARSLRPDVIFMDNTMPVMNGLDALCQIKNLFPEMQVVMVSSESRKKIVMEAVLNGAAGFIVKPFNTVRILEALKHIAISKLEHDQAALKPVKAPFPPIGRQENGQVPCAPCAPPCPPII